MERLIGRGQSRANAILAYNKVLEAYPEAETLVDKKGQVTLHRLVPSTDIPGMTAKEILFCANPY